MRATSWYILWPGSLLGSPLHSGTLIGWHIDRYTIGVLSVVPHSIDKSDEALKYLSETPEWKRWCPTGMSPPTVLGSIESNRKQQEPQVGEEHKQRTVWVTLKSDTNGEMPQVLMIDDQEVPDSAVSFATYTRFSAGSGTHQTKNRDVVAPSSKELLAILSTSGPVEAALLRLLENARLSTIGSSTNRPGTTTSLMNHHTQGRLPFLSSITKIFTLLYVQTIKFSATARQIDGRVKQWKDIFFSLGDDNQKTRWQDVVISIFLDVVLGVVCMLMCFHFIAIGGEDFVLYHLREAEDIIQEGIVWMMQNPAGVKLNPVLAEVIGRMFVYLTESWNELISRFVLSWCSTLLWVVAISGCFGITIMLAVGRDVLSIITLHLFYFYAISTRVCKGMLSILSSLWKLFRGKKQNILRKRVDNHHYGTEQQLVGTLMFTGVCFLFPTVLVYYAYFSVLRLLLVLLYTLCDLLSTTVTHFPIYSFFRSSSLSAGMSLQIRQTQGEHCYLHIASTPVPTGSVLSRYYSSLLRVLPLSS